MVSSLGSVNCSGLLGRTPLRHIGAVPVGGVRDRLFRPSRPDSIETRGIEIPNRCYVVLLFRPSRPDSIETRKL